jgi:hypothetical protein
VPLRNIFISENIQTIKKNTEALVVASKKTGIEINAEKTKYIGMSRDQNARLSHNIMMDNQAFERLEKSQCLGTTLKNQNSIKDDINITVNSGNACRIFCFPV